MASHPPTWRNLSPASDDTSSDVFETPWGTHPPGLLQGLLIAITRKTVLQRGALRKLMTRIILSLSRPIDITFRGCNFRVSARNNLIERGILTRPKYNDQELTFLEDAVRGGGVAVDIGCNIGLYALPLAKAAGPTGKVIAIDANAKMIEHLTFHTKASELNNVTPICLAVGAMETRADLEIRKGDTAIVRVQESESGAIQMRPLLDIIQEAGVPRVDSLKIDIEGHEDAALVPYLQNCPDHLVPSRIVIERAAATNDYPGCVAEFDRLGYTRVGQTKNNSMYLRG